MLSTRLTRPTLDCTGTNTERNIQTRSGLKYISKTPGWSYYWGYYYGDNIFGKEAAVHGTILFKQHAAWLHKQHKQHKQQATQATSNTSNTSNKQYMQTSNTSNKQHKQQATQETSNKTLIASQATILIWLLKQNNMKSQLWYQYQTQNQQENPTYKNSTMIFNLF